MKKKKCVAFHSHKTIVNHHHFHTEKKNEKKTKNSKTQGTDSIV